MPKNVQDTFTEEQLTYLKVAIGARQWGEHGLDCRGVVQVFKYRYYYVFLVGRNRRNLSCKEQKMAIIIQAIVTSMLVFIIVLLTLLVVYLIKSALGIDIIDGYSFGIWDSFRGFFLF